MRHGTVRRAWLRVPGCTDMVPAPCTLCGAMQFQSGHSMAQVTETTLRQHITECTRMMVMAELLDYSGHVSARIPGTDRFLIPPRDASRARLTAAERRGRPAGAGPPTEGRVGAPEEGGVEGGGPRPQPAPATPPAPPAPRPDGAAVAHAPPPMSTLFTMVDRPMMAIRNYGFRFI